VQFHGRINNSTVISISINVNFYNVIDVNKITLGWPRHIFEW